MKKKSTNAELKEYKRHLKAGFGEYVLTQGAKFGILATGLIFLIAYIRGDVGFTGGYIFLGVFSGFFWGLWGWHNMKKMIKEYGKKK